jgi:D-3-phosphoglycerate dehydrogenase
MPKTPQHDPKCLIVQPIHAAGLALLVTHGITPVLCPQADMETVARHVPGCVAAITRDAGFDARAFGAADRLRVLVVHGAGHDPVDKDAAGRAGVLIANTPGTNARSVAELAVGLALAVARRIPAADQSLRSGQTGFRDGARFAEFWGGTALVVGWGATGSMLGAMLHHGFGMHIMAHSPRPPHEDWAQHAPDLHAALAQADLVSLHAPLRAETRNMMDAAAFATIKPGAILVNMARAGLIDEQALCAALAGGRLAGAGLDVASGQAALGTLSAFGTVVFTPHLGGTTQAALSRTAEAAALHVITALAGDMPSTAINPSVWRPRA